METKSSDRRKGHPSEYNSNAQKKTVTGIGLDNQLSSDIPTYASCDRFPIPSDILRVNGRLISFVGVFLRADIDGDTHDLET